MTKQLINNVIKIPLLNIFFKIKPWKNIKIGIKKDGIFNFLDV